MTIDARLARLAEIVDATGGCLRVEKTPGCVWHATYRGGDLGGGVYWNEDGRGATLADALMHLLDKLTFLENGGDR